jgi:hypothetical protein
MPKNKARILAVTCALGFSHPVANAQTIASKPLGGVPAQCQLSEPARIVNSLRDLPEVAAEFRRQNLGIADVGESFNPSDVVDEKSRTLPPRQFVRAYAFKDRTIVWYFRGGFAARFHVVELRTGRDTMPNAPPLLRFTGRTLSGPPCAATDAILAGVDGGQGW